MQGSCRKDHKNIMTHNQLKIQIKGIDYKAKAVKYCRNCYLNYIFINKYKKEFVTKLSSVHLIHYLNHINCFVKLLLKAELLIQVILECNTTFTQMQLNTISIFFLLKEKIFCGTYMR